MNPESKKAALKMKARMQKEKQLNIKINIYPITMAPGKESRVFMERRIKGGDYQSGKLRNRNECKVREKIPSGSDMKK